MIPQVSAVIFVFTLAMMLLLPFYHVSFNGIEHGEPVIFLFHTDFGLNFFAILLVAVPVVGLILSLMAPRRWALEVLILAAIGLVCIPLSMWLLSHEMSGNANIGAHVGPGMGMYVVLVTLGVILIDSALELWHERK